MLDRAIGILSRHRRHRLARKLDTYLVQLHEGFENRNYDFHGNGEGAVLNALAGGLEISTVLDVGANIGDWTAVAARTFPGAAIHSFEIVASTYQRLAERCRDIPRAIPHHVGLSDTPGSIDVYYVPAGHGLATCVRGFSEEFHRLQPQSERAAVTTGDLFCAAHGITEIDLLKIDVEGFEDRVLKGFSGLLRAGRIKVIQFEYGFVNISSKFLLKDFYELLRPFDMVLGKIYPNYVEFRDYQFHHEDFLGPNFLAIHASQKALIDALGQRTA